MGKKSIMRMLLTLSISQICYIFIVIVIFGAGTLFLTETGIILSPQVISESVENITGKAVNGVLEAKDIPAYIEYAQLSNDGNYITGTIQDKELIEEVYKEGQVTHLQFMNGTKYECVNGLSEKWILGYKSGTSQFSNDFLRNVFPSADLTVVLSFFVTVVIGFFIILKWHRNQLRKELNKIISIRETILNDDEQISGVSSTLKEINDILIVLNEMEKAVKDSTKKQLKQAQLLEDGIQALTHDIQTPATVVSGNLELLEETEITEKQKEYLNDAQDGIKRISEYVEELKNLVKMEHLKTDYISLGEEYVNELISLANQIASLKNISIVVLQKDIADDLLIDGKAIQKAFQNIVSNAVDFSEEYTELKLQFQKHISEYRISVTDSGKGFSEESLKRATQKFYSENKARNGTHYGLGLAIVNKIMREHFGFLRLENLEENNKIIGARVTLVFPLDRKF
ncbi:sensor histidine kinase [Coprococcus sp. LG100-32]|uniref:sensor histidine kinase n=1 Tax=Coprococcus sp. LG100-32 TaxID=2997994 RepID=UPI0022E1F39E|nr:HAMP domain-containing sensor histidine kinase [Coprococcus sp. LG100-32]